MEVADRAKAVQFRARAMMTPAIFLVWISPGDVTDIVSADDGCVVFTTKNRLGWYIDKSRDEVAAALAGGET